mmetsp:Transcript_1680/g.4313  ORF Transcript_1680/g.4313 Transcript_1680/m.4313 type:complete len:83 (+) Transcript_1680:215-463(+)
MGERDRTIEKQANTGTRHNDNHPRHGVERASRPQRATDAEIVRTPSSSPWALQLYPHRPPVAAAPAVAFFTPLDATSTTPLT